MNRLVINSSQEVEDNNFLIKEPYKVEHIHQTLKAKVGDEIKVTLLATLHLLSLTLS